MKRIVLSALLIVSGVFTAEARVCFLPEILAGNTDCLTAPNSCTYTRRSPCPTNYDQRSCVKDGLTYYQCTCSVSNTTTNISLFGSTKYICEGNLDECGCKSSETICNPNIYKYTRSDCANNYAGTLPEDECVEPKTGKILYKKCACDSTTYPYTCKGSLNNLQPNTYLGACTDTDGEKYYNSCSCGINWSSDPCSSRSDSCTQTNARLDEDDITCFMCGLKTCSDGLYNLEEYWNIKTTAITTDCATLGYQKTSDTICGDGSAVLLCPFDSSYGFCNTMR